MTVPPVNSMEKFRPFVARKKTAARKVSSDTILNASACRMNGMSWRILKNSIVSSFPRGVPDRHALELAAAAVDQVDYRPAHDDRREDRRHDAQAVHHGEPAHRPGAEQ